MGLLGVGEVEGEIYTSFENKYFVISERLIE